MATRLDRWWTSLHGFLRLQCSKTVSWSTEKNAERPPKPQEPQQPQWNEEEKCSVSSSHRAESSRPQPSGASGKTPHTGHLEETNQSQFALVNFHLRAGKKKNWEEELLMCYQMVINWAERENSQNQNQVHGQNLSGETSVHPLAGFAPSVLIPPAFCRHCTMSQRSGAL